MSYLHIVLMAFNKPVTAALRSQVEACLKNAAHSCTGVEHFELLKNASRTSPEYTHALLSVFTDEQALDTYRMSSAHDILMTELGPHIQSIVVLDSPLQSTMPG